MKKRIYIAGRMRGIPLYNFPAFDAARDRINAAGYKAVSPADIDRANGFDPLNLPLVFDWNEMPPDLDLQTVIDRDVAAIRTCQGYVMLDGWEGSRGATAEKGLLDWQGATRYDLETMMPMGPAQDFKEIYHSTRHDWTPEELRTIAEITADSKPTNPKDIVGSEKLPIHLWPETATAMGCMGLLDGCLKYGRSNYRAIGVRASIYVDACNRHLNAWFEGEDADPDSGLPHLSHALACLAIIVDAQAAGMLADDRQFPGGYRKLVNELTPHVKRLKEKYADRSPKHYTITTEA